MGLEDLLISGSLHGSLGALKKWCEMVKPQIQCQSYQVSPKDRSWDRSCSSFLLMIFRKVSGHLFAFLLIIVFIQKHQIPNGLPDFTRSPEQPRTIGDRLTNEIQRCQKSLNEGDPAPPWKSDEIRLLTPSTKIGTSSVRQIPWHNYYR